MKDQANETLTDKNVTDAEPETEIIDTGEQEPVEPAVPAEAMQEELASLMKEKEDTYARLLRVQAEYDNFKRRSQKEKDAALKYKSQDLVSELLPAMDNFERALQVEVNEQTASFVEGMTMIYNQLKESLKSQGVEEIASTGETFDPNLHHGVMQVEDEEVESNTVVEELQKGYMLKDRVIRPAMVKVNK